MAIICISVLYYIIKQYTTILVQYSPPYTYPNPTWYFIFNFLVISFIENKCLYDVIWDLKREKKNVWQKVDSKPGCSRQKRPRHAFYHLRHWSWWVIAIFLLCWLSQSPNHMLVGGVSVNSLCQQGGLFALSVNRHSIFVIISLNESILVSKKRIYNMI